MVLGRPPKAREIKAAEGNRRKLGKNSIPPPVKLKGAPVPPANLSATEKRLWAFVCGAMPADIFKKADSAILERFVRAWARYGEYQDDIIRRSLYVPISPKAKRVIPNPSIRMQKLAADEMDRCGQQLGLSPAARSRLQGSNDLDDDDDIMDALLGSDGNPDGAWFTEPRTKQ